MILKELIQDLKNIEDIKGDLKKKIEDIVYDSRKASNNSLFICIEGYKDDGHRYINNAISKGAKAILIEKDIDHYRDDITYIRVKNSRKAMSGLAARFYNYPLKDLKLIGVTGTNGKTTTTYLIKSIIDQAGLKTGLIGTINILIGDEEYPATRTTPESLDLYRNFYKMKEKGVKYVIMEVSSHALYLERVKGMRFDLAVFTNISQDHLNFHNTIEEYVKVKSSLFQQLKEKGKGIINIDDSYADQIFQVTNDFYTYGIKKDADFKAFDIKVNPDGLKYRVKGKLDLNFNLKITGKFNVYNSLAAIACGYALNIKEVKIKKGLENSKGIPGRFELIKEGQDFTVVVDYAHTPDGMENVLTTARDIIKGNLIVVFGCGGDRDRGKRPLMGKLGIEYGDYCLVTSDNPRSEKPMDIIKEIEEGIKEIKDRTTPYKILPEREKAIKYAINKAETNDMVIIIGKGHETYQVFKDKTIHFDDREIARKAIKDKLKGE